MDTAVLPEVRRVGGLIGAEIRGLDLTRDYPDETYAAVGRALDEHGVAGMGPVFEALSPGLQSALLGMRAVHANVRKLGLSYEQTDPPEPSVAEYDAAEGSLHPVVRLIPETGRRVLYVNPESTCRFEGWTRRESLPLLRYLFDFAVRPEFVTRFSWAPGSIAFWDNRQVWHFAVNDYQDQRRVMNRILLAGTSPVPAA